MVTAAVMMAVVMVVDMVVGTAVAMAVTMVDMVVTMADMVVMTVGMADTVVVTVEAMVVTVVDMVVAMAEMVVTVDITRIGMAMTGDTAITTRGNITMIIIIIMLTNNTWLYKDPTSFSILARNCITDRTSLYIVRILSFTDLQLLFINPLCWCTDRLSFITSHLLFLINQDPSYIVQVWFHTICTSPTIRTSKSVPSLNMMVGAVVVDTVVVDMVGL